MRNVRPTRAWSQFQGHLQRREATVDASRGQLPQVLKAAHFFPRFASHLFSSNCVAGPLSSDRVVQRVDSYLQLEKKTLIAFVMILLIEDYYLLFSLAALA